MWQQIIAFSIIIIFIFRLSILRKNNKIKSNEFNFWIIFWCLAAIPVLFLIQIDIILFNLGFSGGGINFLLYLAILFLFYLIFKLRLKIVNLEAKLTKLIREIALDSNKKDNNKEDNNK